MFNTRTRNVARVNALRASRFYLKYKGKIIQIDGEIAQEIRRLEEMHKHYKKLSQVKYQTGSRWDPANPTWDPR